MTSRVLRKSSSLFMVVALAISCFAGVSVGVEKASAAPSTPVFTGNKPGVVPQGDSSIAAPAGGTIKTYSALGSARIFTTSTNIGIQSLVTGQTTVSVPATSPTYYGISPDGSTLWYSGSSGALYMARAGDSSATQIHPGNSGYATSVNSMSTDGKIMFIQSFKGGTNGSEYIYNGNDGTTKAISFSTALGVNEAVMSTGVLYMPDGDTIYFMTNTSSYYRYWKYSIASNAATLILQSPTRHDIMTVDSSGNPVSWTTVSGNLTSYTVTSSGFTTNILSAANSTSTSIAANPASDYLFIPISSGKGEWYKISTGEYIPVTYSSTYTYGFVVDANGNVYDGTGKSGMVYLSPVVNPVPMSISVQPETDTVMDISWDAVAGADGYKLYRNNSLIYSGNSTSFVDSTAVSGTSYNYTVAAYTGSNLVTDATVTAPVYSGTSFFKTLVATQNMTDATTNVISWNSDPSATSYVLTRNGTQIYSGPDPTFTDTGINTSTVYTYTVKSMFGSVSGPVTTFYGAIPKYTLGNTTVPQGTYVKFAGINWRVVGDNEVVADSDITSRAWDTSTATSNFDPYSTTNIGYYLNTSYFPNAFSSSEQALVQNTNWQVAINGGGTYNFNAYLAIPTPVTFYGYRFDAQNGHASNFWLLGSGSMSTATYAKSSATLPYNTGGVTTVAPTTSSGVRPVFYFVSSVTVLSGSGTSADPYVVGNPPAVSTPTNVSAGSVTDTSATLSWDEVSGAVSYEVSRDGTVVGNPTTTSFTDSGLSPSTTYTYSVVAIDGSGNRSLAATKQVTTAAHQVAAPTNFRVASKTQNSIQLAWSGSSGATAYEVSRNGNVVYSGNLATFTDTGLDPGTIYHYSLIARDDTTTSSAVTLDAATDTVALTQPQNFTVVGSVYNRVDLSWDPVDNATGYTLTRNGATIADLGTVTSYSDTGLAEKTTYAYSLTPKATGTTGPTAYVSATTPQYVAPDLRPVLGDSTVQATYVGKTEVDLSWGAIQGADTYTVKRGSQIVYTGTDLTFSDVGLSQQTSYTYSVYGSNSYGDSASTSTTVKTLGDAPTKPVNFKATRIYDSQISLQWGIVSGAKEYKVVRDGEVLVYDGNLTSFMDFGLNSETSYTYTVEAVNDYGSAISDPLAVTTAAYVPPISVVVNDQPQETTVSFSFHIVDGATTYYVNRNPQWTYVDNGDGTYALSQYNTVTGAYSDLGNVSPNNGEIAFTETNLPAGQAYHYDVTAVKPASDGSGSEVVVGQQPVDTSTAPAGSTGGTGGSGTGYTGDTGSGGSNTGGSGTGGTNTGSGDNGGGSNTGGTGGTGTGGTGTGGTGTGGTGTGGTGGSTGGSNTGGTGTGGSTGGGTGTGTNGSGSGVGGIGSGGSNGGTGGTGTNGSGTGGSIGGSGGNTGGSGSNGGFIDIGSSWAKDDILYLYDKGIVTGRTATTFEPNATITRAEFTAMVVRALGLQNQQSSSTFKDVKSESWYFDVINIGAQNKLVKGIGQDLFAPSWTVTRQEMATILARILTVNDENYKEGSSVSSGVLDKFKDKSSVAGWAADGVAYLAMDGIMGGVTADTLAPKELGTRAEAAALIRRVLDTL